VLRSVLPADARPAPVVSLQRVAYAAWARGPTLLSLAADGWLCFYRRACGLLLGVSWALRDRSACRTPQASQNQGRLARSLAMDEAPAFQADFANPDAYELACCRVHVDHADGQQAGSSTPLRLTPLPLRLPRIERCRGVKLRVM